MAGHLIFKASGFNQGISPGLHTHTKKKRKTGLGNQQEKGTRGRSSITCSPHLRGGKLRQRISCLAWALLGILWERKGPPCLRPPERSQLLPPISLTSFILVSGHQWQGFWQNLPPFKALHAIYPTRHIGTFLASALHLSAFHMRRSRGREIEVDRLKPKEKSPEAQ